MSFILEPIVYNPKTPGMYTNTKTSQQIRDTFAVGAWKVTSAEGEEKIRYVVAIRAPGIEYPQQARRFSSGKTTVWAQEVTPVVDIETAKLNKANFILPLTLQNVEIQLLVNGDAFENTQKSFTLKKRNPPEKLTEFLRQRLTGSTPALPTTSLSDLHLPADEELLAEEEGGGGGGGGAAGDGPTPGIFAKTVSNIAISDSASEESDESDVASVASDAAASQITPPVEDTPSATPAAPAASAAPTAPATAPAAAAKEPETGWFIKIAYAVMAVAAACLAIFIGLYLKTKLFFTSNA